jgi:hypothetical protein
LTFLDIAVHRFQASALDRLNIQKGGIGDMKRIVLGMALSAGMLFMGVTSASAYCSLDPTLGIGLPIHTSLNISVSLGGATTNIYLHNNSKTTTFGANTGLL